MGGEMATPDEMDRQLFMGAGLGMADRHGCGCGGGMGGGTSVGGFHVSVQRDARPPPGGAPQAPMSELDMLHALGDSKFGRRGRR